jgi:hypothetical protein
MMAQMAQLFLVQAVVLSYSLQAAILEIPQSLTLPPTLLGIIAETRYAFTTDNMCSTNLVLEFFLFFCLPELYNTDFLYKLL